MMVRNLADTGLAASRYLADYREFDIARGLHRALQTRSQP